MDTTTGSCSEFWLMGQPRSSCTRRGFGAAARLLPGAGEARTSGRCRAGAWRACHRDHPCDRWTAARRGGLGAWLAGLARDTGILSRIGRTIKRTYCRVRAVCPVPEDKMTENQSGCLVPYHITLGVVTGGSNTAGRRVIQDSCRICPYPPQTLELLPVSQTDVP